MNELVAISGKPRDLCIQALAAAQNIPDIAFEYLMSGYIPSAADAGGNQANADYGQEAEVDGPDAGAGGMPSLSNYNID